VFKRAHSFRRFLQQTLPEHLAVGPSRKPLRRLRSRSVAALPMALTHRWAPFESDWGGIAEIIAEIPLDHSVGVVPYAGGSKAAVKALRTFLETRLAAYGERRNHPDDDATSGLSPYLHFGHLSVHQVLDRVAANTAWSPADVDYHKAGMRNGWWGLPATVEEFLDELVTWRELGFNASWHDPLYDRFESLPDWAQQTLGEHARDPRPYACPLSGLEGANTHDALWNAAQRQLLREGRIHNYLRMLWGKKILEWTESPARALEVMIHLNNKYAVDGRDPNSYSGIFWVLGRYDRPWGPERQIFGKVRYMTSRSAMRKLRVKEYLNRYAAVQAEPGVLAEVPATEAASFVL